MRWMGGLCLEGHIYAAQFSRTSILLAAYMQTSHAASTQAQMWNVEEGLATLAACAQSA